MRSVLACGLVLGVVVAVRAEIIRVEIKKEEAGGGNIAHMVYFTLKDNSPAARQKLVAACKKYLSGHDGTVYFSAGPRAEEFNRPVNARDWDVALNLVFKDKAAHDKYQDHPRHKKFIAENKDNWKMVRVFDSVVSK